MTSESFLFKGFPGGSDGKESACNAGDLGSIPVFGRCPGEGNGYSGLENSMAWQPPSMWLSCRQEKVEPCPDRL